MGIHGLLKELAPPPRIALAKLSSDHYITHSRPLRLAIDISIWLFQIQSGKGGSNPALRTFYYRLLRLLSLNVWPLFVFDGPNKPLFKRNKKVGGPGVRVASVPEFLAKQLLKQFGFPWHVAPGEAEAECALLQREGVVDAVLSEDVDTLMFGSGVTLRNWTSENSTKSPTHVSVYREQETFERSRGIGREGMILVALMSGGDYLPDGIPGCGPKVACDAARAGFGSQICALGKRDTVGLSEWKERLQHEIRTNASKFFSRKNTGFTIPSDFPNQEVLGYYTHPCVSTPEKLERLRRELKWDQGIDFPALRIFAADAFDWRNLGGAKKFVKNLAPAMLVRELRLLGDKSHQLDGETQQEEVEKKYVRAVHGKRNHATVDGVLEYRISFIPATLVPIDLSLEDEDDDFIPAGGTRADSDTDADDYAPLPPSSTADSESEAPTSPTKKRQMKPFHPDQPEKLWVLRNFLQLGCPLLVEEYEASFKDPKEFLKQRRAAKAAGKKDAEGGGNIHASKAKKTAASSKKKGDGKQAGMQPNALMQYAKVTKAGGSAREREPLKESNSLVNSFSQKAKEVESGVDDGVLKAVGGFKMPSSQLPPAVPHAQHTAAQPSRGTGDVYADVELEALDLTMETTPKARERPFARFTTTAAAPTMASSQPSKFVDDDYEDLISFATRPTSQVPKARAPATTAVASKAKGKGKKQTDAQKERNVQTRPAKPTTPTHRKRRSAELSSPATSQRTITSYYSPSPRKGKQRPDFVNLISSSPAKPTPKAIPMRPLTPTPPNLRHTFVRSPSPSAAPNLFPAIASCNLNGIDGLVEDGILDLTYSPGKLPDTVTKRRKKVPLKRYETAPLFGAVDDDLSFDLGVGDVGRGHGTKGVLPILTSLEPAKSFANAALARVTKLVEDSHPELVGLKEGNHTEFVDGVRNDEMEIMEVCQTRRSHEDKDVAGGGGGVCLSSSEEEGQEEDPPSPSSARRREDWVGGRRSVFAEPTTARVLSVEPPPSSYLTPPTDVSEPEAAMPAPSPPSPSTAIKKKLVKAAKSEPASNPAPRKRTSPRRSITAPATTQTSLRRSPRQPKPTKKAFIIRQSLEGSWKEVDAEMVDMSGDGSGWAQSGGKAMILGGNEEKEKGLRAFRKSGVEVLDMTGA